MSPFVRVLFATLLLICLVGVGLCTWEVVQLRQDLSTLSARVSQVDRRTPEPSAAKASAVALPSSSTSEVEALRRQVAQLAARMASSPAAGREGNHGNDGKAPAGTTQRALPAPAGPTFDAETKEAIKKLVQEAMNDPGTWGGQAVTVNTPMVVSDLDALAKELGLSDTQKAEIGKLFEERDKEMTTAWTPSADGQMPDGKEIERKMKELQQATDDKVKRLLTVEQMKKYDDSQQQGMNSVIWFGGTKAAPAEGK